MRNRRWMAAFASAIFGFVIAGQAPAQPPAGPPEKPPPVAPGFYTANVQPIFVSRCGGCHGANAQRGGLRLDDREAALKGGNSGPVIVPGDAKASKLYQMVASKKMPMDDELSILELENLKDWIDGGAPWPAKRTIPGLVADPRVEAYRLALRNDDKASAAQLLADPSFARARDAKGTTALHHAVVYGSAADVQALIGKGADVSAVNLDGVAPLIWAVRDEAIVRLLVEHGADVNARADSGVTVLQAAAGRGDSAPVLAYLLSKGAKPTPPVAISAASAANLDALKLLFPKVFPIDDPVVAGVLANARVSRCGACIDYMIAQGARGQALSGLLAVAANYGDLAEVRRVLELGATLDGKGPQDATVLIAAAMSDFQPAEKVQLLLAAGADVNAADAHGRTPLYFAQRLHPEVVPLLAAKGAK